MPRGRPIKYIFVTGGVLSGLGKGITAASLGALFQSRGLKVNIQKLDPYLNVDAGTLNPAEHGECFVTKDGAETDLDLGHYERFLDIELTQSSSVMSGRILRKLIDDERAGKYLGKTVQVVPHFTGAIEEQVKEAAKGFDIHIVEIGGTVGDYESPAFFEAIRNLSHDLGPGNAAHVQVVYLPYLETSGEIKTKPAQNAMRDLRSLGIMPDVLVGRSKRPAGKGIKEKLARLTGLDEAGISLLNDADTIYRVPQMLHDERIDDYLLKKLRMPKSRAILNRWHTLVNEATTKHGKQYRVALVAKYMDNEDTYFSVIEAIRAAAWQEKIGLKIEWVNAEELTPRNCKSRLKDFDGIVVPGGFGSRALEGKIAAAGCAMNSKTPYLGLCLGLQMAVVAAARGRLGLDANSTEVDGDTPHPVIHVMEEQRELYGTGGTMRLGNYPCVLRAGTLARRLYKKRQVQERHRHRLEVNNDYRDALEKTGVIFSGISPDGKLAEIVELNDHPFFIASQFHPEFKSRPMRPHPLFLGLIQALQNN